MQVSSSCAPPTRHLTQRVACERSARMRAEMAGVHGWDKACKSAMMRPASGGAENAQRERVGVTELHLSSTLALPPCEFYRKMSTTAAQRRPRACYKAESSARSALFEFCFRPLFKSSRTFAKASKSMKKAELPKVKSMQKRAKAGDCGHVHAGCCDVM